MPRIAMQHAQPKAFRDVETSGQRARVRAIEEARDLKILPDGAMSVASLSRPGARHRVEYFGRPSELTWFACSCPSGHFRGHLPIPCVHAAQAGLRLEAEGLCKWRGGLVYRV